MSDAPWLTVIGLGEDGLDGLCNASREALSQAEYIMGATRHLSLIPDVKGKCVEWPTPFSEGVASLMARRGEPTVIIASGDPFWFGAGTTIAKRLSCNEWRAFPGRSTFSLAAARLGWALEATSCTGLHAAPLTRLRSLLAPKRRIITTVRDGDGVGELGRYLVSCGFETSHCVVLEALGGPRERIIHHEAASLVDQTAIHPVCVAIEVAGDGATTPLAAGYADHWFDNDGQITKRPVRAMTLSALAPRPFEHLWDIGGGSGSVGIEWLLSDPSLQATVIEPRADRVELIRSNAQRLGVDRLRIVQGKAPEVLADLQSPDVVFIGGGLSMELLRHLEGLTGGTRLVANAVTLESEALLSQIHLRLGGDLIRLEVSNAATIGARRGWRAAYPITQWSHML